jgi:phosphatidylglycerophosphate synthase
MSELQQLDYQVQDKSVLLPLYKRCVINPLLPLIPARVNPNTITHIGHLVNLAGMLALAWMPRTRGSAAFAIAALSLHLYNFCDNADGGHARRTNQCSPMGEFLDHGLDLLNTIYISAVAAWATGLPPFGTVVLVTAVVGGGATTFWEQAETGTLHLPLLNQIEAIFGISALLLISMVFGPQIYAYEVGPFTVRALLATVVVASGSFSALQSALRVQRLRGTALHYLPPIGFGIASIVAAASDALDPTLATCTGALGFVYFGLRCLTQRMAGERPTLDRGLAFLTTALLSVAAYKWAGGALVRIPAQLVAVTSLLYLGALALAGAYRGLSLVQSKTRTMRSH